MSPSGCGKAHPSEAERSEFLFLGRRRRLLLRLPFLFLSPSLPPFSGEGFSAEGREEGGFSGAGGESGSSSTELSRRFSMRERSTSPEEAAEGGGAAERSEEMA